VDLINDWKSPIEDKEVSKYLAEHELDITSTTDGTSAHKTADYDIICTPTNYDTEKDSFDTSSDEVVIKRVIETISNTIMVVKSTITLKFI
jgi:UDPglucose 6-dehydrogenase